MSQKSTDQFITIIVVFRKYYIKYSLKEGNTAIVVLESWMLFWLTPRDGQMDMVSDCSLVFWVKTCWFKVNLTSASFWRCAKDLKSQAPQMTQLQHHFEDVMTNWKQSLDFVNMLWGGWSIIHFPCPNICWTKWKDSIFFFSFVVNQLVVDQLMTFYFTLQVCFDNTDHHWNLFKQRGGQWW